MFDAELFSCRNCVQNPGQTPTLGPGLGYCLQHGSLLREPALTTCKYLHRKDLPGFSVDESLREHAAEFAEFPEIVELSSRRPVQRKRYSAQYCWEKNQFEPLLHAIAQYRRLGQGEEEGEVAEESLAKWRFIAAFAGSVDGLRAVVHACLVRRYMRQCGNWQSSYRLILALISEIGIKPAITPAMLCNNGSNGHNLDAAQWEIAFARLSGVQEFGWHSAIQELAFAANAAAEAAAEANVDQLWTALAARQRSWADAVIATSRQAGIFFPQDARRDAGGE